MPKSWRGKVWMRIFKEFSFDSAHYLPHVPDGHKCRRLHGHTYHLRVEVEGKVDRDLGWVVDYSDISAIMKPLLSELDHSCLNNIDGLENPTCENLLLWLGERLFEPVFWEGRATFERVELRETDTAGASLAREEWVEARLLVDRGV